jgi:hypothetical protein
MRRLARQNLGDAIRAVIANVGQLPTSDVVDAGITLYQAGKALFVATEHVKVVLRERARSSPHHGARHVVLEGTEGSATVSDPEPILRMAKGVDVNALRQALGENFSQFFTLQVVPRPEAMARILEYPPAVQAVVFASIEQDFGSGGVGFAPRS